MGANHYEDDFLRNPEAESFSVFKDTHIEKAPSNKIYDMAIRTFG